MTDTNNENGDQTFAFEQLATLVGLPRRTVRYYIQLGLVDRPIGETRAARYTHKHLEQLLTIKRWAAAGFSLERIRELLRTEREPELPLSPRRPGAVEVWSHLYIADGIELLIEPNRAGLTPEEVRALLQCTLDSYQDIKGNDPA